MGAMAGKKLSSLFAFQAGCRHLSVVLKLASAGHIAQLLSYLVVLFRSSPTPDISPADKIHLSNLALMAYFQQALTKATPSAHEKFARQMRQFLDANHSYDESLAARLAAETGEWSTLAHIASNRGLGLEAVETAIGRLLGKADDNGNGLFGIEDVNKQLQEMAGTERSGILAILLHSHAIESSLSSPKQALRLLSVLRVLLPQLDPSSLRSLLAQSRPNNPGVLRAYLALVNDGQQETEDGEERLEVPRALVALTVACCLLLRKDKKKSDGEPIQQDEFLPKLRLAKSAEAGVQKGETRVTRRCLAAGASHALLVRSRDKAALSWGTAASGRLGRGPLPTRFAAANVVDFLSPEAPFGVRVFSVACGRNHSLALADVGVFAWGSSDHGQLGLGLERKASARPAIVPSFAGVAVTALAAGQYHSAALDNRGRVWTWGLGVHGQLGLGDIEDEYVPRKVFRKAKVTCKAAQVACGYAHTAVLTRLGRVYTFGCGLFGQLGNGDNKKSALPLEVEALRKPMRLLACGYFHNVAVSAEDSTLFTWGCNPQVLRLEAQQRRRSRLQAEASAARKASTGETGEVHEPKVDPAGATALIKDLKRQAKQALEEIRGMDQKEEEDKSEDSAKEEKPGAEEQQRPSTDEQPDARSDMMHLLPAPLGGVPGDERGPRTELEQEEDPVVALACGNQHNLAISASGKLFAWGRNLDGQLGTGNRRESPYPTEVTALAGQSVTAIAAGGDYSLAMSESGAVFAWGANGGGQAGKAPSEEGQDSSGASGSSKVVVMRTTRRIIRLPNSMQNSCDEPKPVPGATGRASSVSAAVYSDFNARFSEDEELGAEAADAMKCAADALANFPTSEDPTLVLHAIVERFSDALDVRATIKKCLAADSLDVAAKVALLSGSLLQAFDFSLQLILKRQATVNASSEEDHRAALAERIFRAFAFYLREVRIGREDDDDDLEESGESEDQKMRRLLLERLLACWQDKTLSFTKLETLLAAEGEENPTLLHTLVLTLFREEDGEDQRRPKLVDLFTPEFCLRVGDSSVAAIRQGSGDRCEGQAVQNMAMAGVVLADEDC